MLKFIKSTFVIKKLFCYIFDKVKLNLVKYNKKLQHILNISLINYKIYQILISGEYIVYESNTKGKIYDTYNYRLIYEGELLKGRRNGRGKEYYSELLKPTLLFEGEYLNGKRNGKGKEYFDNGKLRFEGEYLNDEKNGKGKEYNRDGNFEFEGEYLMEKNGMEK